MGRFVLNQVLAFDLGEGELKVVAGSVLAASVVVLIFVLRESNTKLRLFFGLISLALFGWSIYLFTADLAEQTRQQPEVSACKRTLSSLQALAEAKLAAVQTEAEAKAIGQQMLTVIENSPCKPE
jgi:hypothetical protein